jgi:transposase InsO family protein
MSMYPFIEAEKAGQGNVVLTCDLFEVSRSAYYQWHQQRPSQRAEEDAKLAAQIGEIHEESRQTYGAPRVHQELRQKGKRCARKRVARLMKRLGLAGRCPKRWKKTTIADPEAIPTAIDLIGRNFKPGLSLNRVLVGDITYVRTWEGWLYLATVIDLASRRVVGWAMADHMRAELVCDALAMAIAARSPEPGLIFHSDRGSQYTSGKFTKLLAAHGIRQSLSRPRQCWDNAVAESFFSTLKAELVHRQGWPTRARARQAIFEFIEVFYNRRRLHSSLGYLSPAAYEARLTQESPGAQAA